MPRSVGYLPRVRAGKSSDIEAPLHRARAHARWCCAVLLLAGVVHAETGDLGDVVVTATLRPVPVLDVAGSVTVLRPASLGGASLQHLEDVLSLVPNLNWAGDTARPRYFQIRGIGELAQYQGAPNPSIGFLIDDIDFSGIGSAATLFDIDRIEVLRGPQGARYGANALGGLIYMSSAEPTADYTGRIEVGAGNYDTRQYGAVLSGPVPALASGFRLAVQRYTSDGYYTNAYLGRNDTANFDELTVRGRWRVEPSERLRLDLTFLRARLDDGYDDFSIANRRTTYSDQPGQDSQHSTGIAARLEYQLSSALHLTTIASYADSPIRYSYDGDWGNPAVWNPYVYRSSEVQDRHRTTRNLEFRLAGDPAGGTHWVAGIYALNLHETLADAIHNLYQDPTSQYFPPESDSTTSSDYASHSAAIFGEIEQDLSNTLRLEIGLRSERRQVWYADSLTSTDAPALSRAFSPVDRLWGGNLSLEWKPTPLQGVYGLVSRGYKAGGFNLSPGLPTGELEFRPESDLNFEVGYKVDAPELRLHFDGSVFYARRSALQLLTGTQLQTDDPSTFVFYTGNAPRGFNAGLESNLVWQAAPTLEVGLTLGLLRTRYQGLAQSGVTLPDRAVPHAPSWQGATHLMWKDPRGVFARVELTGMGRFYFDLPPNPTASRAYALVNLRLGYETPRGSLSVWARNLLDKNYAVRGFYFGDEPPDFPDKEYLQLGPPRTVGIEAMRRF